MKTKAKISFMTKLVSLLLIFFSLIILFNFENVNVVEKYDNIKQKVKSANNQNRIGDILMTKILNISLKQESESLKFKILKDFNDNEYILTECEPTGYTIFHPSSANFVESSPTAPSPYKGLTGDLLYVGPTEYYIPTENGYLHTITGENMDMTYYEDYVMLSKILNDDLMSEIDILNYAYIYNEQLDYDNYYRQFTSRDSLVLNRSISSGRIEWFKNLFFCGYTQSEGMEGYGCCGFIALNIIIAYFDKFIDNSFMDDKYWRNPEKTLLYNYEESLSYKLHSDNPKNSTTSMHIDKVSKDYLKDRGITGVKHTDLWAPFFTKGTIKKKIDSGYPVIIFGNLNQARSGEAEKGNHAVVAYSYSGNDFTCHYGWNYYEEVTIKGTFGSIYCMEK